jgi:hypothetical protein
MIVDRSAWIVFRGLAFPLHKLSNIPDMQMIYSCTDKPLPATVLTKFDPTLLDQRILRGDRLNRMGEESSIPILPATTSTSGPMDHPSRSTRTEPRPTASTPPSAPDCRVVSYSNTGHQTLTLLTKFSLPSIAASCQHSPTWSNNTMRWRTKGNGRGKQHTRLIGGDQHFWTHGQS